MARSVADSWSRELIDVGGLCRGDPVEVGLHGADSRKRRLPGWFPSVGFASAVSITDGSSSAPVEASAGRGGRGGATGEGRPRRGARATNARRRAASVIPVRAVWRSLRRRLARSELVDLRLDVLLVEELPAGQPVDVRAQGRDTVLIGVLHARLPRDRGREQVIAKDEVPGSADVSRGRPRPQRGPGPDQPRRTVKVRMCSPRAMMTRCGGRRRTLRFGSGVGRATCAAAARMVLGRQTFG